MGSGSSYKLDEWQLSQMFSRFSVKGKSISQSTRNSVGKPGNSQSDLKSILPKKF